MNEVQIEAALTLSDPESEARKKVEEAIREIVRSELVRQGTSMLHQNAGLIHNLLDIRFTPTDQIFRDGVLSVLRDYLDATRPFNRRY